MAKGYMVFVVTTANGAVPILGARVFISANDETVYGITDEIGKTPSLGFNFKDNFTPCFLGEAFVSFEGYRTARIKDIKIYRGITTVRIINLHRESL